MGATFTSIDTTPKVKSVSITMKVPEDQLSLFKNTTKAKGYRYQTYLNRLIYLANQGKLQEVA